jgi:hypothetical protein
VKRVLVLGATELGKAVAVLLREHGMMVDLWDARPPKEIHNLVKWATARMMTPYFGVPVPSGVYCLWVRCDGEPLAGGEVSPVELAEMYPECPFAERVLELCGRVVADPRLEGLDLDGMDPGDAKRALREMEGGKGPVELSRQPWHPAGGGPGNTRYFPLRIFIAMKTRLEEWMSGASCHA